MYTVITTIVCIFAIYGVIRFTLSVFAVLNPHIPDLKDSGHTVLFFKNSQDDAEIRIRSLIWDMALSGKNPISSIIAVDFGSVDDTFSILKKLEKEYDTLCVMTCDEYIKLIKDY